MENCIKIKTDRTHKDSRKRCLPNLLISNVRLIVSKIDELSVVVSINQIDFVYITENRES
jgi:hypothetical protein